MEEVNRSFSCARLNKMLCGQDQVYYKYWASGVVAVSVSLLAIGIIGLFIQNYKIAIGGALGSMSISCVNAGYNRYVFQKLKREQHPLMDDRVIEM